MQTTDTEFIMFSGIFPEGFMKRFLAPLVLIILILNSYGCIISSTPNVNQVSINGNSTMDFSVVAYGDIRWFVDDAEQGSYRGAYTYHYTPTGLEGESQIIKVQVVNSGRYYFREWAVTIAECNTGQWDNDFYISRAEDVRDLIGNTVINGDLIIEEDPGLTDDEQDQFVTSLNGLECLTQITGGLFISSSINLHNVNNLRFVSQIGGDVDISGTSLRSLNLNNLVAIGGALRVIGNSNLTGLQGLGSLNSVGGGYCCFQQPVVVKRDRPRADYRCPWGLDNRFKRNTQPERRAEYQNRAGKSHHRCKPYPVTNPFFQS